MFTITPPGDDYGWTQQRIEEWNALIPKRANRLRSNILRREFGAGAYFEVKEFQKRGLIHLHILVRAQRYERPWVIDLDRLRSRVVALGFGPRLMLSLGPGTQGAAYVAKYVSKEVTARRSLPKCERPRWRVWTAARDWSLEPAQRAKARGALVSLCVSYSNTHTEYVDIQSLDELVGLAGHAQPPPRQLDLLSNVS